MDDEEIYARRRRAEAELNRVRGEFLVEMIDLESHLDRAIVYFYGPDELRLFVGTVLDRLNFVSKIDIMRKMLRHAGLAEKHKPLLKEINALRMARNKFAHQAFEFVGNSYLWEGGNYELYIKERLDPGAKVEGIIHLHDLRALVRRAAEAKNQAMLAERELTEAHDPPSEYFYREGWDPHNLFAAHQNQTDPNELQENEE